MIIIQLKNRAGIYRSESGIEDTPAGETVGWQLCD